MRHIFFIVALMIIAGLVVTGCAPHRVAQLDKHPPGHPPATVQPETRPHAAMEDRQKAGVAPDDAIAVRELPKETITDRPLAKVKPPDIGPTIRELQARIQDVYFDFDRYDIRADAKPILREVASILLRNNNLKLILEGHTDERGTNEYNLGLGDMRATSVREYLISLGVSSGRIETISYGEEKPVCKEQTEECWALNRRAHFVLFEEIK
jgi:peptidoglycan-associated lipoprotein